MANTELHIYDKDLKFQGVADVFSSLRWRRKYFDAGEFEIHLQATVKNIILFRKNNIVVREGCTEAGLIKSVELVETKQSTTLTVKGRFLSHLLYRRIIQSRINFTGTVTNGMRRLLSEMTPFNSLEVENTTIPSETISFQCTYRNVYNFINRLSLASNIGFRVVADIQNKKLIFQNFVGINRTRKQKENPFYEFSEEYSNIEQANYLTDNRTLCNYALVGGEGEGSARVLVIINNTAGLHDFDIVERFVDAKMITQGELTLAQYRELLREHGNDFIQEITKSINYDVYTDDYKTKWDLGDIVTVKKESWGIEEDLRVTEVEEVIEGNTRRITPTFRYSIV